jgi:transcriptional regulator with XRE-family HTH domain
MAKTKIKHMGSTDTLGTRLKALLAARNLSQGALSRALGVTGAAVSQWVNDGSDPTPVNLILLADFFSVSVRFLVIGRAGRVPGTRIPPYLQRTNGRLLSADPEAPLTVNGE